MIVAFTLNPLESQLVLLPIVLIVVVLCFMVFLTEMESVLSRRRSSRFFSSPRSRRRWRRSRPDVDSSDLQRALLERTSRERTGAGRW